jgi:enoyl-CoA hydratase/carnithine racemase
MSDQLVLVETRDRSRRAVHFNIRHSWDEMERYEQETCREVFAHPDAAEGPRAFTEKREPRFTDL